MANTNGPDQVGNKLLEAVKQDLGISEKMAQPIVDSVMRCFAGERVYFPATNRSYPTEDIRRALEQGVEPKAVQKTFGLSRSKLHVLFPGGLPGASVRRAISRRTARV